MHLPQERKNGKNQAINPKSEKDAASPSEEVFTYGIDRLNPGKPVNDSSFIGVEDRKSVV